MAKIRGSVALALTFLNLFASIALLSLSSVSLDEENRYDGDYYSYVRKLSQIENLHSNLRGTKIRTIKLKDLIEKKNSNKNIIYETLDYNEDEFILPKNILKKTSSQKIRKLETSSSDSTFSNEDKMISILLLSCLGISFSVLLMFSFCLDTNECCNRDAQDELGLRCCIYCFFCDCHCENSGSSNCDCKGNGNNNDGAAILLILLLVIIVFILLYFAVKACGKHVSRYVAITSECLLNIAIMVLALMYNADDYRASENGPVLIVISGILIICNFLGILLPNLSCCLNLRYGYKPNLSNLNTPILEQPVEKSNTNEEAYKLSSISSPTPVIEAKSTTPVVQPTVPIYVPQVPQPQAAPPSIYQNIPPYQAPAPQPYPQPSSDFYNSGQGGIYNYPPPAYDQPQSIYQAQQPYQQDNYDQIPKPQ